MAAALERVARQRYTGSDFTLEQLAESHITSGLVVGRDGLHRAGLMVLSPLRLPGRNRLQSSAQGLDIAEQHCGAT